MQSKIKIKKTNKSINKYDIPVTKEFKKWLNKSLKEDVGILDELAKR